MNISKPDDRLVVSLILDGSQEEYRQLVERYHVGLINHLYNLTRDEDLAQDIAQEAFIRAFDKLDQYNPEFAFSTWLYRIADNLAFRSLKQRKSTVDLSKVEEFLEDEKTERIDEIIDKEISNNQVREAVQTLDPRYQQVIALYYWDNLNYEEISLVIDKPVGTVRTWLYRGKEKLRKELYGQIR